MKWLNKSWIAGFLVLLVASLATAEIITIQFEGIVDFVEDPYWDLEGNITQGDTFSGTYTYDTDTLDTNTSQSVGDYWHYSDPYGISAIIGGLEFKTDPSDVEFLVQIANDHPWFEPDINKDGFFLRSYNNCDLPNGAIVENITWQLDDKTGQAINSVALPTAGPVLNDWESSFGFRIEGGERRYRIYTTITAVPEPSISLLLLSGSILLRKR